MSEKWYCPCQVDNDKKDQLSGMSKIFYRTHANFILYSVIIIKINVFMN